jgi:hypothetical protein
MIEDLRYQLQRAENDRDAAQRSQQRDHVGQESLVQRLQQSVEQLESTNCTQEQVCLQGFFPRTVPFPIFVSGVGLNVATFCACAVSACGELSTSRCSSFPGDDGDKR